MNGTLYRLEVQRLVRTHTFLGLTLLCAAVGLVAPVLLYYTEDLVQMADPGAEMPVELPVVTEVEALGAYMELIAPLGVLMLVLMAASSLSVDSSPSRSIFYRTRVSGAADLILPRFALPVVAAGVAFAVGALTAWVVTSLLFGGVPVGPTLMGSLLFLVYLVLVVAVVALVASLTRSTIATVGFSVLALVVVLMVGQLPFLAHLAPSGLLQSQAELTGGAPLSDFGPMTLVTFVLAVVCLGLSIRLSDRRET